MSDPSDTDDPRAKLKRFQEELENESKIVPKETKPKESEPESESESEGEEDIEKEIEETTKKPKRAHKTEKTDTEFQNRMKKMEDTIAELTKQNEEIAKELTKKKDFISINFPPKKGAAASVMLVPIVNIEKLVKELDGLTIHNPSLMKAWEVSSTMNMKVAADCIPKTEATKDNVPDLCNPKGLFRDAHFRTLFNDVARHLRKAKAAGGSARPTQDNDLQKLQTWAESFTIDITTLDAFKNFIREYLFGTD